MSSSLDPTSGVASMLPGISTVIPGTMTNIGKNQTKQKWFKYFFQHIFSFAPVSHPMKVNVIDFL